MRLTTLLICATSLGACGPTQPAAHTSDCSPIPTGPLPRALPKHVSRVGVAVSVDEQQLLDAISKAAPRTVASARALDIGAAGRVDYDVVHTGLELETTRSEVRVSTRLEGDIRVCKPLGPFCARYGTCRPSWQVAFELPTRFESGLDLQAQTHIQLDKGCVLQPVGYDASAELQKITRTQAASVRRRVQRELAAARQQLAQAWQQLTEPQRLPSGACLRVSDPILSYAPPSRAQGAVEFAAELRGTATLTAGPSDATPEQTDCVARGELRAPIELRTLPVHVADELKPEVDVALAEAWPVSELQLALEQALGEPVTVAIVGGSEAVSAPNELFVALGAGETRSSAPSCARWMKVRPELDAGRLRLVPSNEDTEGVDDTTRNVLASLSAARLALPHASNLWATGDADSAVSGEEKIAIERLAPALADLWPRAREQAEQHGFRLEHDLRVQKQVLVDAAGLVFVQRLRGNVRLVSARFSVADVFGSALSSKQ